MEHLSLTDALSELILCVTSIIDNYIGNGQYVYSISREEEPYLQLCRCIDRDKAKQLNNAIYKHKGFAAYINISASVLEVCIRTVCCDTLFLQSAKSVAASLGLHPEYRIWDLL